MINHFRNLLLNRSGTPSTPRTTPGEEFVDPRFVARIPPSYLRTPLQILFGRSPDRVYLNYRLRQIMQMLHETELEEYILAFDRRVTYLPFDNDEFLTSVFGAEINQFSGSSSLTLTGSHVGNDGPGITQQQWRVEVMSGNNVEIRRRTPPLTDSVLPYTLAAGRTSQIPLSGTDLLFEIQDPVIGDAWEIYSTGRPQQSLADLLPQFSASLGDVGLIGLFGIAPVEPFLTFQNLWLQNPLFGYKYGGLLLAIGHALDQSPQVQ